MELTFATPALLFPAVSLLFISYTNRFLAYADLVRTLHRRWEEDPTSVLSAQIGNLRLRIGLIRNMQIAGALSLLAAVICMILLYLQLHPAAEIAFGAALLGLSLSLVFLVWELTISVRALNIQMSDIEG
ncbi:MAG: DUF2721 domain-containing protein [Spirochaetota bacterium]